MRLFYALTFNKRTKRRITPYRDQIQEHAHRGNFTREGNFHMTLEFIGPVVIRRRRMLKNILHQLEARPLTVTVNRYGNFAKKNRKIVWLGIEPNATIEALRESLVYKLNAIGIETDQRPYQPHITLGRQVKPKSSLEELSIESFELPIYSIALMESKRINNVLVYEPIAQVKIPEL